MDWQVCFCSLGTELLCPLGATALAAPLSCPSGYRPLVVKLCKSVFCSANDSAKDSDPGREGSQHCHWGRVEGELASAIIDRARQQKSSIVNVHTCLLITAL